MNTNAGATTPNPKQKRAKTEQTLHTKNTQNNNQNNSYIPLRGDLQALQLRPQASLVPCSRLSLPDRLRQLGRQLGELQGFWTATHKQPEEKRQENPKRTHKQRASTRDHSPRAFVSDHKTRPTDKYNTNNVLHILRARLASIARRVQLTKNERTYISTCKFRKSTLGVSLFRCVLYRRK